MGRNRNLFKLRTTVCTDQNQILPWSASLAAKCQQHAALHTSRHQWKARAEHNCNFERKFIFLVLIFRIDTRSMIVSGWSAARCHAFDKRGVRERHTDSMSFDAYDDAFYNYLSALELKYCARLAMVSGRPQDFLPELHFIAGFNRLSFECATAAINIKKSAPAGCRLFADKFSILPIAATLQKKRK